MRRHHDVPDQWLLTQGTNTDASRCSGSVASDAGNQSPCKEGRGEKLDPTRHSSDLVERRLQTRFHQVRPECQVHVLHGFARIQTWDRVSISSKNHDERTVPKEHVLHQSLSSQQHPAVPQNDTNVLLFHTQRDSV